MEGNIPGGVTYTSIYFSFPSSSLSIVPGLGKCLKFMSCRGVILYRVQSFLSPRVDLNFRYLLSCDTKVFSVSFMYTAD